MCLAMKQLLMGLPSFNNPSWDCFLWQASNFFGFLGSPYWLFWVPNQAKKAWFINVLLFSRLRQSKTLLPNVKRCMWSGCLHDGYLFFVAEWQVYLYWNFSGRIDAFVNLITPHWGLCVCFFLFPGLIYQITLTIEHLIVHVVSKALYLTQ